MANNGNNNEKDTSTKRFKPHAHKGKSGKSIFGYSKGGKVKTK